MSWNIKFNLFSIFKGFQDSLKKIFNPKMPASYLKALSSDNETQNNFFFNNENYLSMPYLVQAMITHRSMRIIRKENTTG